MSNSTPRLVVLISAGGTTLQNLIDRIADGRLNAEIVRVVTSRGDVQGVERARNANLPVEIVPTISANFSKRIFEIARRDNPDLVILAGWLHLIAIPNDFQHKVLNIHPSLLPAFGGKGMYGHLVHQAVLKHGVKLTGCTVHFADNSYDTGPIVLQKAVPVLDYDSVETLTERVRDAEYDALPEAIKKIANGGWRIDGRCVRF